LTKLSPVLVAVVVLVVKLQNIPVGRTTLSAPDMFRDHVESFDLGHVISLLLPSLLAEGLDHARRTFQTTEANLAISET
jgi:hypothetical protein